ncbi:MAG TPA: class II aldolase/adducin family protein [Firmicutes bacterium]|jgi:L-fuculose-phosphate aldolase|nr:class II aldolase/adducin family protein [Bacillota bacterium]
MKEKELREIIVEIGNQLLERRLTSGTGGNVSGRLEGQDWFLITPSGIPYPEITPEDLVRLDLNGKQVGGTYKPSIEKNMHLKIFQQRDDINIIIHTHSLYAQAVACTRKAIPPILDAVAIMFGGPIAVAEYARPGSPELAENVAAKLVKENGCLIANHGAIAAGKDYAEAMEYCELIESAAQVFLFSQIIGNPVALTPEEIKANLDFFNSQYGQ